MSPIGRLPAVVRDRVVSVRLTGAERLIWTGAQERSPWRSLAHWVRENVADGLGRLAVDDRPGSLPQSAALPDEVGERIAAACSRLNRAAHVSNRLGRALPDAGDLAVEVAALAAGAAGMVSARRRPGGAAVTPVRLTVGRTEIREHLVNVRLSAAEHGQWATAAEAAGWPHVGGWARAFVGGLLGIVVWLPRANQPDSVRSVVRQLAGAITNLSQLTRLAAEENAQAAAGLAACQARIQTAVRMLFDAESADADGNPAGGS